MAGRFEPNFANCLEIWSYAVFKNGLDEKDQLKVAMVNMFVTFASFQLFVPDVQQIYEAISGLIVNKELLSFPWRPGDLLCLVYLFKVVIVNIVMLLTYEVCVLFVDNVKAKVFKEYSAGFPCYSLLHTFELEAEEYMVDMLNVKPLVRNEISMAYLFPALQARPVVKCVEY